MGNPFLDPPVVGGSETPTPPEPSLDTYSEIDEDDGYIDASTPMPHISWLCVGVKQSNMAKKADQPHMMATGSEPDQPTTDVSGKYRSGQCPECRCRTIWKRVTL